MLSGKKISILGDSISTYVGLSNDGSANASTKYNPCHYRPPFPPERTYWMRVINELGLTLCVNNSWSGGNLSGKDDPSSGLNRASELSRDDGTTPDIIILFMGTNDLGRRVPIDRFTTDYNKTLETVKALHPNAYVCCVNIPDRDIYLHSAAVLFNSAISDGVAMMGDRFFVADLFGSRLRGDFYYMNTTDGLHPDEDGMKIISEIVRDAIVLNIKS